MIAPPPYLFLTAHDVRSRRKTDIHFIAAELARRGPTQVFSVAFSALSRLRGRDPRLGLEAHANRVEWVDGVEAFLWRTPVHPGALPAPLQSLSAPTFALYRRAAPARLHDWVRAAGTVLVEAGAGILFLPDVARLNPAARIIYLASDDLRTVGVDPYLRRRLTDCAPLVHYARLPSPVLAQGLPDALRKVVIPHGVDTAALHRPTPSPFRPGVRTGVSVGSMLFDPSAVRAAALAHPEVELHLIGAGRAMADAPPNLVQHPETPFEQTLAFLQHADFGLAPYRAAAGAAYLANTSMKLMQYGALGLPAVCPHFACGGRKLRFGYDPADPATVGQAVAQALAAGRQTPEDVLTWAEVTDRLLDPDAFDDTRL